MKKFIAFLALVLLSVLPAVSCALAEETAGIMPGDELLFGSFPQTADGTDRTPIKWTVLEVQDGKCLLLSKDGLDARPYNDEDVCVTWETCTLRSWLNHEFAETAFSESELSAVLVTDVDNSPAQGYSGWKALEWNNTQDRIFLLSFSEAKQYLGITYHEGYSRRARTHPTAYAVRSGAWTEKAILTMSGEFSGWWLLRSPGRDEEHAACVNNGGSLSDCRFTLGSGCIRPVMWVSAEAFENRN